MTSMIDNQRSLFRKYSLTPNLGLHTRKGSSNSAELHPPHLVVCPSCLETEAHCSSGWPPPLHCLVSVFKALELQACTPYPAHTVFKKQLLLMKRMSIVIKNDVLSFFKHNNQVSFLLIVWGLIIHFAYLQAPFSSCCNLLFTSVSS